MTMENSRLIAGLKRLRDQQEFTRTRIGQPGSPVRLEAADRIADLDEAIRLLEWRPIETAPKDDVEVDLLTGSGPVRAFWTVVPGGVNGWCQDMDYHLPVEDPTHWRPIS